MDLRRFTGTSAFCSAYQVMLENDTHAQGSVDRVLASRVIRLCADTVDFLYGSFTPLGLGYVNGSRVELERVVSSYELRSWG
jgi:hypothetical protein